MTKGRRVTWTPAEIEFIKSVSGKRRVEILALVQEKFDRPDISVDNIKSLCTRMHWPADDRGCFKKGSTPANKGKKMPFNANSAATQFKQGHKPPNVRGVGHERIESKGGYVMICIAMTNPHTGAPRHYVFKHRHLWEAKNGPLPDNMCLKSIDGNRLNCDPDNWMAIPRAMLPRLNGFRGYDYDNAPDELKPLIMAQAKLKHALREKQNA